MTAFPDLDPAPVPVNPAKTSWLYTLVELTAEVIDSALLADFDSAVAALRSLQAEGALKLRVYSAWSELTCNNLVADMVPTAVMATAKGTVTAFTSKNKERHLQEIEDF